MAALHAGARLRAVGSRVRPRSRLRRSRAVAISVAYQATDLRVTTIDWGRAVTGRSNRRHPALNLGSSSAAPRRIDDALAIRLACLQRSTVTETADAQAVASARTDKSPLLLLRATAVWPRLLLVQEQAVLQYRVASGRFLSTVTDTTQIHARTRNRYPVVAPRASHSMRRAR